ncbi:MAG TPA: hypothetical protein VN285_08815 [Candidatus Deferrimicrobium sp.]|nr:hypothetical protein [Candidatus Deferrimicrobium sp.]
MRGSVIIERLNDPDLRRQWHSRLEGLAKALERLERARESHGRSVPNLEYLEAVLQFADARDDERNFFWDVFVEVRASNKRQ